MQNFDKFDEDAETSESSYQRNFSLSSGNEIERIICNRTILNLTNRIAQTKFQNFRVYQLTQNSELDRWKAGHE